MSHNGNILIPFKVMSSFPVGLTCGYKILLVDLKGFVNSVKLEWYKEAIMKLVPQIDNEKKTLEKVILARKLRPRFFLPGDIFSVIYESKYSSTIPRFIEFSYASLNSPKFCKRGLVMLTSLDKCPLIADCPYYEPKDLYCKYLIHYKNVTYSELFEIEPSIRVKGDYDIIKTLLCLFYGKGPLVRISEIHFSTPLIYIDKVTVKNRLWPTTSYFMLEPKYKVGWGVKAMRGLLFTYYKESLQKIIEKVMSDSRARRTLEYNYYLLKRRLRTPVYASIIQKVVKDLKELYHHRYLRKYRDMVLGDDFINYCEYIIIHLITHFFINYICKNVPISIEKVYHDIRVTNDIVEVIVTSDDPLMHQVIKLLKERPIRILNDLVNQAYELVRREEFKKLSLKTEINEKGINRIIRTIINFINTTGYLPHPFILWTYINLKVKKYKTKEKEIDKLVSLLVNSLATKGFNLVQAKNCHYDFIAQWTFFNPTLLPPLLNELKTVLTNNDIILLKGKESSTSYLISSLLSLANERVHIVTGYLSSKVIKRLIKPHIQRGVNTSLLAGIVFRSKNYGIIVKETVDKRLRVKILSKRLPKYTLIIVDNAVALIGYWNLTYTNLKTTGNRSLLFCNSQKVKALAKYLKFQVLGEPVYPKTERK